MSQIKYANSNSKDTELRYSIINGIYEVAIKIASFYEANALIQFKECKIYESMEQCIPTCKLTVVAPTDYLNHDLRMSFDAAQIDIYIKTLDTKIEDEGIEAPKKFEQFKLNEHYTFRLYEIDDIKIKGIYTEFTIYGVFDCYDLFGDGNTYNKYANTSEIVKDIAENAKLNPIIDDTEDKQLWVAGEKNTKDFISYMAKYGWINNPVEATDKVGNKKNDTNTEETKEKISKAGIIWYVDRNKNLVYKDITNLYDNGCKDNNCMKFIPTPGPGNNTAEDIEGRYWTYAYLTANVKNGINNIRHGGYAKTNSYFDFISTNEKNTENNSTDEENKKNKETINYKYKTKTYSNVYCDAGRDLNINTDVNKRLSGLWYSFNIGNNHKNFYTAARQNERVLAMYGTDVIATCQYFQDIQLGDILNLVPNFTVIQDNNNDDEPVPLKLLEGKAMVASHIISITNISVTAKVGLVIQGFQKTEEMEARLGKNKSTEQDQQPYQTDTRTDRYVA